MASKPLAVRQNDRLQELLTIGVRPKDVIGILPTVATQYIDPAHIMLAEVRDALHLTDPLRVFEGQEETGRPVKVVAPESGERVRVNADYLRRILDALDSETVTLTVATDRPLVIHTLTREPVQRDVTVYVAPVIMEEDE